MCSRGHSRMNGNDNLVCVVWNIVQGWPQKRVTFRKCNNFSMSEYFYTIFGHFMVDKCTTILKLK